MKRYVIYRDHWVYVFADTESNACTLGYFHLDVLLEDVLKNNHIMGYIPYSIKDIIYTYDSLEDFKETYPEVFV